jgi:hypothetical protein
MKKLFDSFTIQFLFFYLEVKASQDYKSKTSKQLLNKSNSMVQKYSSY